jgi:hypothetical protein
MTHRHPILYDVQRWRQNRVWLLVPGTVSVALVVLIDVLRPAAQGAAAAWAVVGAFLYALAILYWVRAHFSYLHVAGDQLVVRTLPLGARLALVQVRGVRSAPLRSVFDRPARQRLLPRRGLARGGTDWLDVEAVMVRLDRETDASRLLRALGRRCIVGVDLVVPVADAAGLAHEIEAASPSLAARGARGPRPGRRRR